MVFFSEGLVARSFFCLEGSFSMRSLLRHVFPHLAITGLQLDAVVMLQLRWPDYRKFLRMLFLLAGAGLRWHCLAHFLNRSSIAT